MQLSLVLLSVFALAASTPVDVVNINEDLLSQDAARSSALENTVLNLLENFRKTMLTGSSDIPVLDPFELDSLSLDEDILTIPGATLTITDLIVNQLSEFVVDSLSISTASLIPLRYRALFEGHIPEVDGSASNYDLSAVVSGDQVTGNGDATVTLVEPRLTGNLLVQVRITLFSGIYLTLTSTDLRLYLLGFSSQINGLSVNGEDQTDYLNEYFKTFVPEAVDTYATEISAVLNDVVQTYANNILKDLDVSSL